MLTRLYMLNVYNIILPIYAMVIRHPQSQLPQLMIIDDI